MTTATTTTAATPATPAADLDAFVALSAALTGIAATMLRPRLDTFQLAQTYLAIIARHCPEVLAELLAAYRANKTSPPATIADVLLNQSGDAVRYLSRSTMLLWYLAAWYEPEQLQNPPPGGPQFRIVSQDAYINGWVWAVAQTHPMGYSQWSFGYWTQDPPPLAAFIGGDGS